MCNQIHAELYKLWRRGETYSILGVMIAIVSAAIALFAFAQTQQANNPDEINLFFCLIVLPPMFMIGLYLCSMGGQAIFHDQYKHGTLKNEVSFGLSRSSIYLSRWVASLIACAILLIVTLTVYILGSALVLGLGTDEALMNTLGVPMNHVFSYVFGYLGNSLLYAMPLWVGGLSLYLMCNFIFTSGNIAAMCYFFTLVGAEPLLNLLGDHIHPMFATISSYTLTAPFFWLMSPDVFTADVFAYPWLVGMGWTLASTALGMTIFHRREIK